MRVTVTWHDGQTSRAEAWSRMFSGPLPRRQNSSRHSAEADAVAGALAPAGQRDPVTVFEESAGLAVRQRERFAASPRLFQETPARFGTRAADRPCRKQVARPQIAA